MMIYSKLKLLMFLTVALTLLFAPFLIDIAPDGKTYAFSSKNHNKGSNTKSKGTFYGYTAPANDQPTNNDPAPGNNHSAPAPVPEPATLLLVGGGALGLAALRKFKKNK
jgi:hypothetical protein